MIRIAMSAAASGVLRALLARAGVSRNRILLTDFQSTEWQSLTFIGERHQIRLRIPAPKSEEIVRRLTAGLEDAEFAIPGHIVADIGVAGAPRRNGDGSVIVDFEALTIAE